MEIRLYSCWHILCGYIFKPYEIVVGSLWAGGGVVKVEANDGEWIRYSWYEKGVRKEHEKDWFSFQCRYSLIISFNAGELK